MKKIERLRKEALESCKFHGHRMESFSRKYRHWWDSKCKDCGRVVFINDCSPNGLEISGEAVAVYCNGMLV